VVADHGGHPAHSLLALQAVEDLMTQALERLEWVPGWGEAVGAAAFVHRPSTAEGVHAVLDAARRADVSVTPRGAGCSYGDAAFRAEQVVMDTSRMNRILAWDPATGVIDVEPGVTLRRLWRFALGDGWWPPVVTGTMETTVGGCLGMNVHGKNNSARGTFGEHCLEFEWITPDGGLSVVRPQHSPELFHAAIGSFGLLGVLTRVRLQLKRVHSGLLDVKAVSAPNLEGLLRLADEATADWEYVVGWLDAFPRGRSLGRGLLHYARHLEPGEDPAPAQSLHIGNQDLAPDILGFFPKGAMWRGLKIFTNRPGMRVVNAAKYRMGATVGEGARYRQGFAEFSFLLDYVPGWKRAYLPGGLIQHQSFVPKDAAEAVFARQLAACRRAGLPSFLGVLKRHRPDAFLMSHAVDGYSLALDFPVTRSNRDRLWRLVAELAEPVVEAGGRFYPAKDAAIPGELYRATFGNGQIRQLLDMKNGTDSGHLLRSALADRLLGGW
jgi:decaprenylphospho-beta-D-ribofuranose 2-oxidase